MEQQKSCDNCKAFIKHYYLLNCKLVNTHCGHCSKRKCKPYVKCDAYCDKWETVENTQPKQKESIEKSLMETAKRIKEIIAILKCEN